jgi:hypothetical protein
MNWFEHYILVPSITLGIFSTAMLLYIILFDDINRLVKKFKKNRAFRAKVAVRLVMYGVLFLLSLVVHYV